jgi:carbon monoxide dehydrogenase subunit G
MFDEVDITPDAVNKTIQIDYYWDGTITAVADAGGGEVIITSADHRLETTNEITISSTSGNYDGTFEVTRVDEDSFKITCTFAGTDTGTWQCSDEVFPGFTYWQWNLHWNDVSCMDGSNWDRTQLSTSRWYKLYYETVTPSQGLQMSTAWSNAVGENVNVIPEWWKEFYPAGLTSYDRPYIEIENETLTVQDLYDAISAHHGGVYYDTRTFVLIAQLNIINSTISFSNLLILFSGRHERDTAVADDGWKISNSDVTYIHSWRGTPSAYFYRCLINGQYSDSLLWDYGYYEECTLRPYVNFSFYGSLISDPVLKDVTINCLTNRIIYYYYPSWTNGNYWENVVINGYYFYIYSPSTFPTFPDVYLKNIELNTTYASRDIYYYRSTNGEIINCINVKAPSKTNGKPDVVYNIGTSTGHGFNFYFSMDFTVLDDAGDPISGATVTVTDKDGTEYTDTTDANGQVSLNVLSHHSRQDGSVYDYNSFTIEIEATGYQSYLEEGLELYDAYENQIALQFESIRISSITTTHPTEETSPNGSIVIAASGGSGTYEYSKDGGSTWQANGTFSSLDEDDYSMQIRDDAGHESDTLVVSLINQNEYRDTIAVDIEEVEEVGVTITSLQEIEVDVEEFELITI